MRKGQRITSFLLVFFLTLAIMGNVNKKIVRAESIGDTKTLYSWVTRQEIVNEIGALNYASSVYISAFAGFLGKVAKTTWQGAAVGTLVGVINVGAKVSQEQLKAILKDIDARGATGVLLKSNYTYMYMSGSGTGWYYTSGSVNLYW